MKALRTSLAIVVALALLVPASALAASGRTVAVSATATVKVPNDTARLSFGVTRERRSRGAALRAASSGLRQVIAAVQTIPGVGPGDVRTGRIGVRKVQHGKAVLYRASEGIGVTLHEPKRAGELVQAAIGAGASGLSGPSFFVGDPEAAYDTALAAAFQKAKAKATTLATQAGATLGPALSIVEGGAETEFGSPKGAAGAPEEEAEAPPVKPGTSTVTARVSVVFELL